MFVYLCFSLGCVYFGNYLHRDPALFCRDHPIELGAIAWANLGFVPVGDHQGS
tara:strand:- start:145 stop:303 length:159 start_codon:yes stop_codon:yes gene_type:complete